MTSRSMFPFLQFVNLMALYVGKTSGVFVAFVFLPIYSRLLGPELFGIVAVILSLQALLLMMDLGMSTLVSREVAANQFAIPVQKNLIRSAEINLAGFYLLLFFCALIVKAIGGLSEERWGLFLGAIVLFWLLVLQNLYYSVMLAHRNYNIASTIQFFGTLFRAIVTAYVLIEVSPTLIAFVSSQLLTALIHAAVTRIFCFRIFSDSFPIKVSASCILDAFALLKQGRSLVMFSAAGAAVTQLDKPLISAFVSSASVAPYFLATTLCMVPVAILAGPVTQYFQPKLLNEAIAGNPNEAKKTLYNFVMVMFFVTSIPSLIFWLMRESFIDIWMGGGAGNYLISSYVAIMLPGFAIGAFGFIPYVLLISARDYRFQAIMSVAMTVMTLMAVVFFALRQNVEGICYAYATYHAGSTMVSWARAIFIPQTKLLAKYSFSLTLKNFVIGLIFGIVILFCLK